MKSRRDNAIDAVLNRNQPDEEAIDKSLRAQAFRRANSKTPPKTLTAWEWEEWYQRNGMPENFKAAKTTRKFSWCFWKKSSAKSAVKAVPKNCVRSADEDAEF